MRSLLTPLGELAAKHGAAVVAVSHFNKGGQQQQGALLRVMGSLAFVAAARAAFAVVKDQNEPNRRLFLPLKNNVGGDILGYAFTVESVTLDDNIRTSRINWEPEAVTITAEEAMTPTTGDAEERSEFEEAKAFLEHLLADGPVLEKQIEADAKGGGYAWATMRRAKKALSIKATKDGMKGPWLWTLSTKVLKNPEDAHSKTMSTFGKNEHLRQEDAEKTIWTLEL